MLIAVTAPKKGMGQTTTAINIAAMLSKYLTKEKKNGKIIMLDINKYCKDIEYYLSDTSATRGLDDFYSLAVSNLLTDDTFKSCVKTINDNIDIMATNEYYELDKDSSSKLIDYSSKLYEFTILDSIAARNLPPLVEDFYERADVIVVVLNQIKSVIQLFIERELYKKYKDKIIFVLNKELSEIDEDIMEYNHKVIQKELKVAGYDNLLLPLSFDLEVVNQSNFGSILSVVMSESVEKRKYTKDLKALVKSILEQDIEHYNMISEDEEVEKTSFINKLFGKH